MKLRVVVFSVILLLAFVALAIAEEGAAAGADKQPLLGRKVVQQLGLNKDQVQKIRQIVHKYHQDVATVLKSSASKEQKAAQVKDIRTKAAAAINAVLTPDQQAKAQKMRLIELLLAPRPVKAEVGFLAMVMKLDLTPDQRAKIKAIVTESEAAAKAIRADTSLKPAEKAKKLADLRKATNQKILALLTPAQKAKLKAMMKNRPGPRK